MSLEAAIQANTEAVMQLIAVLESNAGAAGPVTAPSPSRDGASSASSGKAAPAADIDDADDLVGDDIADDEPVAYETVQAAMRQLVQTVGKDKARGVLKTYNAKHLKEVKEEARPALLARINSMIAAAESES